MKDKTRIFLLFFGFSNVKTRVQKSLRFNYLDYNNLMKNFMILIKNKDSERYINDIENSKEFEIFFKEDCNSFDYRVMTDIRN